MTTRTLVLRNLRFYARSHLGVVIGAAIATAVLTGALVVGDSMRESLKQRALAKLGWVHFAMAPPDRFFAQRFSDLFGNVPQRLLGTPRPAFHPAPPEFVSVGLRLPGTIARQDGSARANNVNVFGIHPDFWPTNANPGNLPSNSVMVSAALAEQLRVRPGDQVVLRIRKPSATSREIAVTPHNEETAVLNLTVCGVLAANTMGDFSLRTEPTPPLNAFVNLAELSESVDLKSKANLMLLPAASEHSLPRALRISSGNRIQSWVMQHWLALRAKVGAPAENGLTAMNTEESLDYLNQRLNEVPFLEDLGLELRPVAQQRSFELRSGQIFLESELVREINDPRPKNWLAPRVSAYPVPPSWTLSNTLRTIELDRAQIATNHCDLLTLLANLIRDGTNSTPYSMVTAAGPPYTPAGLRDDQIILTRWLADDLHAVAGDEISFVCFDPDSGARLVERTNTFRVHSIVPQALPWDDRMLMPDFPGIEKAESTSDWDAGFPLVYKIRPQDEDYWKKFKGTPKAFISLAAGQKMWGNRFGNLTAIRFPVPDGTVPAQFHDVLEKQILTSLNPNALGLRFDAVREQALHGAEQSEDFGQLFLGFSIFLVVAALLLMALLFQLGLERRVSEIGILLALGFRPGQVRGIFLFEGIVLSSAGAIAGAWGGTLYAKAMLLGLATIWRNAVGAVPLHYFTGPGTLAISVAASVLVAVVALWLTLRKQGRRPARELLAGTVEGQMSTVSSRKSGLMRWISLGSAFAALGIVAWSFTSGSRVDPEAFFSAGCLFLVSGITGSAAFLASLVYGVPPLGGPNEPAPSPAPSSKLTLTSLCVRACARRRKRSVTTVALLASGCFLIVAIGVFRLDANQDGLKSTSGTGGFALLGNSTLPITQDLNTKTGREAFGLSDQDLSRVRIVPFRVRDGDDASCLNLNRAQKPRLLGVNPGLLVGRFTFSSRRSNDADNQTHSGWNLLKVSDGNADEIPAIGDANSIQWALHKKVGDTIDYTDEHGRPFKLRLVGAVANSILQGSLIIDEAEFIKRFRGESGYRSFLIEAPSNSVTQVSETLSRAFQDVGLELTPTVQRLNTFNAVQNTYLGTFQILGGLGLLLGSAGLAIVVLRNVLERRGELGLLTAVGFTRRTLNQMTLIENSALLTLGLACGSLSALVAVLPALLTPGRSLPYLSLAITLAAVIVNGLLWTWLSTRLALRGNLLQALRNE